MSPRRWLFPALLALLVAVAAEGMSFVTSRVLARRGVLYLPAALPDYVSYLARRDPELGWPPLRGDPRAGERDASGSRVVPAFPEPGPECVALFGDSFTWAADVDAESAWGNQLARRLRCRVGNQGVPGYGSDQALLRYRRTPAQPGRVVVLAHLTENVMRNVNRYRALLYPGAIDGFKPRFVLDAEGRLAVLPLPRIDPARYPDFVRAPERFLDHEYFAPGGPSGLRHARFPYTLSVLQAFGHFHVREAIAGRPWYAGFYEASHPSRALQTTTAVLTAFVREARERAERPLVMVLGTRLDLDHFAGHGRWVHAPLVSALEARGIEVFDGAAALAARLSGGAAQQLFDTAHYNQRGNAWLAELVAQALYRRGLGPHAARSGSRAPAHGAAGPVRGPAPGRHAAGRSAGLPAVRG